MDQACQHCANPVRLAKQSVRVLFTDELHSANRLDGDGNFACFTPGFGEPLPLLAFGESVGAFADQTHCLACRSQQLVREASVAAGDPFGDAMDVSKHLESHPVAI